MALLKYELADQLESIDPGSLASDYLKNFPDRLKDTRAVLKSLLCVTAAR